MAFTKLCRCGRKISIDKDTCEHCTSRHSRYDKDRSRDISKFYKSHRWTVLSKIVRTQANHVDLYQLHINNKIIPCDMVHHIVPVKDDWSKRYDIDNLIPLSNATHEYIEQTYARGQREKIEMQRVLLAIRGVSPEGEEKKV